MARALNLLGIDFGEHLTQGDTLWNPTGFWEDHEISYEINRALFFALNYSWDSATLVDINQLNQNQLGLFRNLAVKILEKRFQCSPHFGFKDPRTTKIIPFWQSVFELMQLKAHYLIALRNPLAVAYSLKKLRKFDIELGLFLWLMHLMPAIEATMHQNTMIVSYELMLSQPTTEWSRIKKQLNLFSSDSNIGYHFKHEFLNKNLNHYPYSMNDLKNHSASKIIPLVISVYELLSQVAEDKIKLMDISFVNAWQAIQDEFNKQYPLFLYIDTILKNQKRLERLLRSIQRSFLWKAIYPLRLIDEALRRRRKSLHEKRTLKKSFG